MPNPAAARKSIMRAATAAVATAAIVGASACSSDPSSPSGNNGSPVNAITIPVQRIPNSLDPAALAEGQEVLIWSAVFDTLLWVDNEGELVGNAAEAWDYSDDAKSITFTLRDDLTFETGVPITADDVKATLERTKQTPGPQQAAANLIESVDAPDDRTVVVNLVAPDSSFVYYFARALGVIGDPGTLNNEDSSTDPTSSGPYTLDADRTIEGSTYVLTRRDDHWAKEDYPFETLTIQVLSDSTARFNALQAGQIDVGTVGVPQAKQLSKASSGFTIESLPGANSTKMMIVDREGAIEPALADPRVRQALNMAIDREGIVAGIAQGAGTPGVQALPETSPAFDPELDELYPYDPEAARELLAEAGYPDGFSLSTPSTFASPPFEPTLTQAFADIGVDLSWEAVPPQNVNAEVINRNYPIFFYTENITPLPIYMSLNYRDAGLRNPFDTTTPELDAMFDEVSTTLDPAAANEIYTDINRYATENAWNLPILLNPDTYATREGISYLTNETGALLSVRNFGVTE